MKNLDIASGPMLARDSMPNNSSSMLGINSPSNAFVDRRFTHQPNAVTAAAVPPRGKKGSLNFNQNMLK